MYEWLQWCKYTTPTSIKFSTILIVFVTDIAKSGVHELLAKYTMKITKLYMTIFETLKH